MTAARTAPARRTAGPHVAGPAWLGIIRAPFLLLALSCAALGIAAAWLASGRPASLDIVLVFAGALAAHISVNSLNEYSDFRTGLDFGTRKTPFNGGSGVLPARGELAWVALTTGLVALAITAAIGIHFIAARGWPILLAGLPGVAVIALYTPWIGRHWLPCLVAPGIGFGTCMVNATCFALTGTYTPAAFAASLIPFFLVSNLLLLNQLPDMVADRRVGRRNVPLVFGRRAAAGVYAAFLVSSYAVIAVAVAIRLFPLAAAAGLLTAAVGLPSAMAVLRQGPSDDALLRHQGINVIVNLATPALMAAGMILGR
ncbi:MAG: prenyltransferase [Candidatus Coatesbacteria bacterium]